jgi:hypothetical protein
MFKKIPLKIKNFQEFFRHSVSTIVLNESVQCVCVQQLTFIQCDQMLSSKKPPSYSQKTPQFSQHIIFKKSPQNQPIFFFIFIVANTRFFKLKLGEKKQIPNFVFIRIMIPKIWRNKNFLEFPIIDRGPQPPTAPTPPPPPSSVFRKN